MLISNHSHIPGFQPSMQIRDNYYATSYIKLEKMAAQWYKVCLYIQEQIVKFENVTWLDKQINHPLSTIITLSAIDHKLWSGGCSAGQCMLIHRHMKGVFSYPKLIL